MLKIFRLNGTLYNHCFIVHGADIRRVKFEYYRDGDLASLGTNTLYNIELDAMSIDATVITC